MSEAERLPDDALVVRGGIVIGEQLFIRSVHHQGVYGFSVQCSPDKCLVELVIEGGIKNGRVGTTTVGTIRAAGYDVVRTSGKGFHATVVVSPDWSEAEAESLATLFTSEENPVRKR